MAETQGQFYSFVALSDGRLEPTRQEIMLVDRPRNRKEKPPPRKNRGWSQIIPGKRTFSDEAATEGSIVRSTHFAPVSHAKTVRMTCWFDNPGAVNKRLWG